MKNLNYTWVFLVIILSVSGCLGKKQLEVKFKDPSAFQTTTGNLNISTVAVVSNQLIIRGSGLGDITSVKLSEGGVDQTLTVESATAGEIVAKGVSAVNIGVGKIFDMILSDANGSVTFPVSFSLDNASVTAAMLAPMGATPGQVLKYTLTGWAPVSQTETQAYIGTWDATTTIPDITATVAGDYYVVSVAGGTYALGDWIISDGYAWSKLAYSKTSVSSFQNRKGIVTLVPADYVSLKAATTPFKIPGSSINDFLDVDLSTAPLDGQVLKYTTAGGLNKWVAGTAGSASNIGLSDLSATAPLTYNNTTGVFSLVTADLLATQLTNLASGSGAVTATDTLLGAFGKLMAVPSDYVSKSSGATMTTGTIALSGTAMITVPTASGVTAAEVANVTYVTNAIAANGAWSKGTGASSSTINFSTGNVGIGTETPGSMLDVNSTAAASKGLTIKGAASQAADYLNILDSSNNIKLAVTSNGRLGIGAAPNEVGVNRQLLQIVGSQGLGQLLLSSSNSANTTKESALTFGHYNTGWVSYAGVSGLSNATQNIVAVGGLPTGSTMLVNNLPAATDLEFKTASSTTTITGGTTRMKIDSSGNVGVGTISPSALFSVGSSSQFQVNSSGNITSIGGTTSALTSSYLNLTASGSDATITNDAPAAGGNLNLSASSGGGDVKLRTEGFNGTIRMIIKPTTGNVGIGTITPATKLDVAGGASIGNFISTSGASSINTSLLNIGSSTALTNASTGTEAALRLIRNGTSGTKYAMSADFNIGTYATGLAAQSQLDFRLGNGNVLTPDTTVMSLLGNGNVGIGTTGPTATLHISSASSNLLRINNSSQDVMVVNNTGDFTTVTGAFRPSSSNTEQHIVIRPDLDYIGVMADHQLVWRSLNTGSFFSVGANDTGIGRQSAGIVKITNGSSGNGSLYAGGAGNNYFAGNVGIGTPSPSKLLHLSGATPTLEISSVDNSTNPIISLTKSGHASFSISNTSTGGGIIFNAGSGAAAYQSYQFQTGGTSRLFINGSSGNVGIGTIIPGYNLDVAGTLNVSGATTNVSDSRFKQNISPITNAIEKLKKITGVSYDWAVDEFPEKKFSHRKQIGVIAQDVQAVFPELVSRDQSGYLSVNYQGLIGPLIEVFKDQQRQIVENVRMFKTMQGEIEQIKLVVDENKREIAAANNKIRKLEKENSEMKERLDKIEKLLMENKLKLHQR